MAFDDRLHESGGAPDAGEAETAAQPAADPSAQPAADPAAAGSSARPIVSTSAAPSVTGPDASCAADLSDADPADAACPAGPESADSDPVNPATPAGSGSASPDVADSESHDHVGHDSEHHDPADLDAADVAVHNDALIQAADALLTQVPAPFSDDAGTEQGGAPADPAPEAFAPEMPVPDEAAAFFPAAAQVFAPEEADPAAVVAAQAPARRHMALRVLGIAALVLAVAFTGLIIALAVSDADRIRYVPANTSIDGELDISGLTEDELRRTIEERFTGEQSKRVTIDFASEKREIELNNVGELDVDAMVDAAFAPYAVPIVDRMIDHVGEIFGDEQPARSVATTVKPVAEKVRLAVEGIAAEFDRDMHDAHWEFSDEEGKPVVVPAQDGRHIDVEATVAAVQKDIANTAETGEVDGVVSVERAQSDDAGQAIYVDTSACVLHFYENGAETLTYKCTPGKSGYTTPHGDWTLSYKDPAPTWYNPHSSWSAGMAETIAPGASNPLGLRALALSCGGGIFIHGTTNKSQLGTRASHGCVRLANDDVVALYDIVETGIPIYVR